MKIISYTIISALISFWLGKPQPIVTPDNPASVIAEEPCYENNLLALQQTVNILTDDIAHTTDRPSPAPLSPVAPTISATKTVMVITDTPPTGNGPGDVLEYTIVISNTGTMEATGVMFNDQIDSHTTLVANSVKTSPIARPDTYTGVVGNISISIPAAQGLLNNDVELDGDVVTVTSVNTAGTMGNVTFNPDGSFTFNPAPGFEGTTTFTYTSTDGMFTSTSTVSITVSGMIWFINAAAGGGGDGRLSAPFNSIASFNSTAMDDPGDNIFLYSGAYSSALTLLNNQKLIGQGASSSISTITGLTPPATSPSLPATGGSNPTIANAVTTLTVMMNNQVHGITINNSGGTAFTGNNLGTLKVRDMTVSNTAGIALNLTNGALDVIFKSVSASNASHGIRLNTTTGSLQINGTGTTDGSGGTFSTISQRGIELISATNITLKNLTMTNANTVDAGYSGICDESNNTSCNAAIYMSGVTTISLDNVDITGTEEEGINGNNVSGFSIANSTLAGTGNAEEDNAFKMINMTGTCSITNCTMGTPGYRIVHIINNTGNVNLTVNNCSFNNTQNSAIGQDCFEMRTRSSATATVDLMNSNFIKARSKAIQMQAEDASTMSVDITNCNVQRMSTIMAGIDIGSVSTATINFNVNGNPMIESSREVTMLASSASSSILNGRFNGNPIVTYSDSGPSIFATVRMLQEQNSVAKIEVGNNVISATNGQETVLGIARLGSTAASRLDFIAHDNNITYDVNGIEGIELRVGQGSSPAETNTHCGYVHHNSVTAGGPRAFRVRELNASGDMRLQGTGPTLASYWTNNTNSNTGGAISEVGSLTYGVTCNAPTHPGPLMAPPDQGLALDPNEGPDMPVEEPAATPAAIEASADANDLPESPTAIVMSGETVTVGAPSGFPLPANQTMTIKFRVTVDPLPAGVCQVANQGTITGTNFSQVMTDDPGTGAPLDPTVTTMSIPPTITDCQDNVVTTTDPDQCTASVMFSSVGEGCPLPTFTYKIGATTITSPYNFPLGTTTVDVTASNGNLPNATCSFTVQVTDDQAPDITCLSGTQMRGTNLGNCSYTVQGAEFNPTVDENCPGYTLTNDFNNMASLAGAQLPVGTTNVVWTITDGALLQDMCTVTIQVTDDDPPTISCPPAASTPCNINDLPPYASYTQFTMAGGSANDNCGINTSSFMFVSQTGGSGTYMRTYQISDVNGQSSTCIQTVTVSDMTPPTVTAGSINACYPTVAAAEAAAIAATTATDNCPGMLNYSASTAGTCSAVITVTVTDEANNSDFVTYNTRIDNTPPTVTPGSINACYPTVAAAEAAALAATTVSDNCPGTITKMASTVGTCSAVITITASDECGNSNFVTYNTSIDNAGPTVSTGTIAACYPTVAAAEAAAIAATTAMDDCPSNIVKTASTVGTCSAVVTVTATDACGNSAMTTYNTRIDNTPPTVTPGSIAACYQTVAAAEAAAIAATTASDNCPGTVTKTAATVGTCSATVTVTATDECGNSNFVTYSTRIDNTPPTVTPGTINSCYPTVAAAEAAAIAATTATDNCPGAVTKTAATVGTCSAVITVTGTDGCGNTNSVTYSTRIDNTGPTVTPGTIGLCYPTVAAAEAAAIAATTATDGCPGTVTKTASTVGTCSATVTVTATDECGNSNFVTYNTRIDNTPPTMTPGSINACYPTVAAAEAAALAATTVSDNCPGTVTKMASTVGTCSAVITITASDECGNSNFVTYNTSIDNAGPTVSTGTIAACYPTVAAAEAAAIAATTAMDDCPSNIVKTASTVGTCSAVVTVTATDACGNSAMTTYNTRIDNTPPTVTPGSIAACYQTVAAAEAAAIAATTASDNCPGTVTKTASTAGTCSAVVTVTATDGCGNSATATYSTRIDNTAPTVTPGTIATCYPTVAAAEAAAIAATTATDNCPGTVTKTASTVGTCSAVVTVTATDGCGNSATTTYNTRIDNTAPTVTPGTIAACYQTVAAAEAAAIAATTATDNCPGTVTKTASTVGTCSAVVTVTATDGCGNSSSVTYNTRIDNTPPTVTAGSIAMCYPTVAAAEAAALAATTVSDNCPGTVTKTASTAGTCTAVITVTGTDGCGNSSAVTYSTRIDNTGPTITPGTIAPCYLTVAAAEAAALAATTVVDDCPSSIVKTASTVGTCSAVITITATDGCGNSAMTTYNTKIDNTPPTAVCKNSTVLLTGDGQYLLTGADVLNLGLTSDNCGSYTVTTNPVSVNCNQLNQTIPVVVTVADMCGNSTVCTAQVTVMEGTALPSGWTGENIGSTAMGSSQFKPCTNGGAFTLDTKGYTTNVTDVEHSVYRVLCGDGEIIAHVASVTPGGGWAGIQMRETSSQGSKKFTLKTQLSTILRREIRTVTFGPTNTLQMPVPPSHTWLRITRSGSNFTSYSSPDGVTWTFRSAASIPMNSCIQMGVFVESFNNTTTTTAVIDNVTTSGSGGILPLAGGPSIPTDSYLSVQIFPNPTSGITNVVMENGIGKTGTLIVYNGQGQQVLIREIQELSTQELIDLTNFADGVYWVKIQVEGYLPVTRKLIRAHAVRP